LEKARITMSSAEFQLITPPITEMFQLPFFETALPEASPALPGTSGGTKGSGAASFEPYPAPGNQWQPPFLIVEDERGAVVVDSYVRARQDPTLIALALRLYEEGRKHVLRASAMRNGLRREIGDFGYTRAQALRWAEALLSNHNRLVKRLSAERAKGGGNPYKVDSLEEQIRDPQYDAARLLLETRQDHEEPYLRRLREADAAQRKGRGLQLKAQRQATCGIYARQYDGSACGQPRYRPFRCKNRYCLKCSPKIFATYLQNYSVLGLRVDSFLANERAFLELTPAEKESLARYEGAFRLRILDITTLSRSEMPSPEEVQQFEKDVKKLQRRIAKHLGLPARLVPYLYCDEFGHNNTNLHCHGLLLSPYIDLLLLSEWWKEIRGDGSYRVLINEALDFPSALAHALEYTGKWAAAGDPDRAVELELVFQGVRRVHALGWFHCLAREPGEDDDEGVGSSPCPCGRPGCVLMLRTDLPWRPIAFFEKHGIPCIPDRAGGP
jgi:hypothetical protein